MLILYSLLINWVAEGVPSKVNNSKAELLQVGIFFLIHLFAWEILLIKKKLAMEETKTTQYSTFKTDMIKVGLIF